MRQGILRVGLLGGVLCVWLCAEARAADATEPGFYANFDVGVNFLSEVEGREFDLGLRFGVAGGYRFTPMISAEIETGYLYNEVKDAEDNTLSHVPLLANVMFRFENKSPFVPFVGVGVGGVVSFLTIDDVISEDDDSAVVFAWQVQAGVHYRINANMSAGITYKYLGVDSPEFDVGGGTIELDVLHNHAILASFNWAF